MSRKKSLQKSLPRVKNLTLAHYKLYFTGLTAFGIVLIISGFIYLGYRFYEKTVLSFDSNLQANTSLKINQPVRISIPKVNIETGIEPTKIVNGVWMVSDANASFPEGSLAPGEGGNIIIYGHNKSSVFGNLKKVAIGDKVALTTKTNEIFLYKVSDILRVTPDRTDVVGQTNEEVLTMYTCIGFLDSQRLVVKAKPFKIE